MNNQEVVKLLSQVGLDFTNPDLAQSIRDLAEDRQRLLDTMVIIERLTLNVNDSDRLRLRVREKAADVIREVVGI